MLWFGATHHKNQAYLLLNVSLSENLIRLAAVRYTIVAGQWLCKAAKATKTMKRKLKIKGVTLYVPLSHTYKHK